MDTTPDDKNVQNELLRKYLGSITFQLMFGVPRAERQAIREEVTQHIAAMVEDEAAQGKPQEEAVRAALRRFGDPRKVGKDIRKRWLQKHPHGWLGGSQREVVWKAIYWLLLFSISMITMLPLSMSNIFGMLVSAHGFFQTFVGSLEFAFISLAVLWVSGLIAAVLAGKTIDPVMGLLLQQGLLFPPEAKKSKTKRRQKDAAREIENMPTAIAATQFNLNRKLSRVLFAPVWKKIGRWASNALVLWIYLYLAWHLFHAILKGSGAVWQFVAMSLGCACGMIALKYLWALFAQFFNGTGRDGAK